MRRLITATLLSLAIATASAATQMEELALTLHPTDFPDKVEQLFRSGNNAAALELTELGLKKNPKSLQLRFMRANATLHPTDFPDKVEQLFRSGNNAAALELTELGLKKNPKSLQLRFMRANALERLGRTQEARQSLTDMIAQYPEIPDPYNNLARLEAAEGRLEEAVRLLHRALLINPDFALARKNLGDVYLALAPYNNLARLEAAEGRLEEAVRLLHRALLINPDFALARKNLGDVYLALARECYEKASPQLPANRSLAYRLETLKRLEARH